MNKKFHRYLYPFDALLDFFGFRAELKFLCYTHALSTDATCFHKQKFLTERFLVIDLNTESIFSNVKNMFA